MKQPDRQTRQKGRSPQGRTLRERVREAADGLKERAKKMNSDEKTVQPVAEEDAQTAQPETEQETQAQAVDPAALQEELDKARAQCEEYLDLAQRKQAEFANYRRRTENTRREAYEEGQRDTVEKLLPVVDNLERALSAAQGEESALKSGVEMVLRQTCDTLAKLGVEAIDPQGEPFDATWMNAVMQGTAEEGEPGTVCAVLQKGYKLGERVIRHAMVKVVAG